MPTWIDATKSASERPSKNWRVDPYSRLTVKLPMRLFCTGIGEWGAPGITAPFSLHEGICVGGRYISRPATFG